ncbi:MAG: hypothetical protein JJT96_00400 [Opitutales bacterium]|nr:hypothetical protein [Opitutales bacterium]
MYPIKIVSWKGDVWALRICIASIRYWYPDVRIEIYKDIARGDFALGDLVTQFNCIEKTLQKKYGSAISKLELLFSEKRERYFVLDTDCVLVGRVFDGISTEADFVVSADYVDDPNCDWFRETYYDIAKLVNQFDSDFVYPGYVFNTGQMVATSGILKESDFRPLIDFSADNPSLREPGIFSLYDQGVLNYTLVKRAQEGQLSLSPHVNFHLWPLTKDPVNHAFARENQPSIEAVRYRANKHPFIIHWAGLFRHDSYQHSLRLLPWGYLLEFYENLYYSKAEKNLGRRLKIERFKNRVAGAIKRRFRSFKPSKEC